MTTERGRTLIVCGQGAFPDTALIVRALERCITERGVTHIACTGGMEKHVRPLASKHGVQHKAYAAEYRHYGPVGAIVRNVHMLDDANPDMVIGFTDTLDDNTVDLLRRAAKMGVPTFLISTTVVTLRETVTA